MNIPKINWLQKDEDSKVTEEELDRPYAFYKRIYTRREFEELREKIDVLYNRRTKTQIEEPVEVPDVSPDVKVKGMSDEERFFENIDYIFANREIIFADKKLASSMPIEFGYRIKWLGGRILALSDILHLWEQDKWKWKCPKCGEKSYLFYSQGTSGRVYCPKCKKIVRVWLEDEDGHIYVKHHHEANKLLEALPYKRRDIGPHGWTTAVHRLTERIHKKTPFSSNLHSYKEVFGQIENGKQMTQEERTVRAQFEVAKKHGEKIAEWLEQLSGSHWTQKRRKKASKPLNIKQISPVMEMLERIKELAGEGQTTAN